jgi:hypothetical protein
MKESLLKSSHVSFSVKEEEKDMHDMYSSDESYSESLIATSSPKKKGKKDFFKHEENREYGLCIDEIMAYYFKLGDVFRAITFSHAAKGIRECNYIISSSKDALHVPGVGKAIAAIYDELSQTGKVERLEILRTGKLPKPPRAAFKKLSNFPEEYHEEHDHEHPKKKLAKSAIVENEVNEPFSSHLQEIVDIYFSHIEDKDMVQAGLNLNRYNNRVREESKPLAVILHDKRRYKKIANLFSEFSTTGTSELLSRLKNGEKAYLPKTRIATKS